MGIYKNIINHTIGSTLVDRVGLQRDSHDAGRLRANQVRNLIGITPLMMAANLVNSVVILVFLYGQPNTAFLPIWTAAVFLLSFLALMHWKKNHGRKDVKTVSHRGLMKMAKSSAIFGALWGLVPALLYPGASQGGQVLLVAVAGGMMGGGAMSLYVIPRAMTGWIFGIATGTAIGLSASGTWTDYGVLLLLICYTALLLKAAKSLAYNYGNSVLRAYQLEEKNETISVVLKDFSESASDWLWQTNAEGQLVYGDEGFLSNLGAVPQAFGVDHPISTRADTNIRQIKGMQDVRRHWEDRTPFTDIQLSLSKDGKTNWISISGKPLTDEAGNYSGFRGVASNITENKLAEERIAFLAHNDALTGLVNRSHFSKAIAQQISQADADQPWAVMFLDLDGFKLVNDSKGHGAGDELLEEVAARIKKQVSDEDIVARLGGDEFAVLCRSAGSVQALSAKSDRLIEAISAPYLLQSGHSVAGVGVSIGIALGDRDGKAHDELLHNADLALYRAKSEGKGTYRFFELEMDEIVRERRLIEQDLREALQNGELSLSYQPLVSASQQHIEGFEALVRWNHPERGTISPAEFIPIAESMGLISEIGDWVIREACTQAVNWPDHLFVAVNLSPQQFVRGKIIDSVTRALMDTGLKPSRLELEITEGLLIDNTEEVTFALRELKGMGVSVALDDFGTGYSSLSYLLKFPFDKLKIDRSFISAIEGDEVAKNVLEAIAKLGNVLDLKVTAEGVETLDQVEALKAFNCTHFQGFLFGKPLLLEDLPAYLLSHGDANGLKKGEKTAEGSEDIRVA